MEESLEWNGFLVFFIPFLFFIAKFSPTLASKSCKLFFLPTKNEGDLLKQALALKQEMAQISMVDEFAKYAKLQRRLNQLKLSLESDVKARNSVYNSMTRMVTFALYALIAIVYLLTLFQYGKSYPVLVMPSRWFFPMSYMFSYPTGISGAISIPVWSLISRTAITTITK